MRVFIRQSPNGDTFRVWLRPEDRDDLSYEQRSALDGAFDSWPEAKTAAEGAFPDCKIEAG